MDDIPNSQLRLGRAWSGARNRITQSLGGRSLADFLPRARALTGLATEDMTVVRGGGGGGLLIKSFIALVALPSIAFFLYAAIWQSNRYVAETRLTVRAAQEQRGAISDASSIVGKLSNSSPKTSIQDSYIVLNYIKSQSILIDLGGSPYLEKYFSLDEVDAISRLKRGASIEDQLKYWLGGVTASVDAISGILTLKVEAYRADDATAIANDVVRLSEALINNITIRSRKDSLDRAEREVKLAAGKLAAARDKLTEFRNKSSLIDPASRAQSVGEAIGRLTLDKIAIENTLTTLSRSLDADSPTQRISRFRLAAINDQIAELNKKLTDPTSNQAVSSQIASYEQLKLDEQFSERIYAITESSYQRARQEVEKQQLYLVVVVQPSRPERPTYPRVMLTSFQIFMALFIFWSISALIVESINDQML